MHAWIGWYCLCQRLLTTLLFDPLFTKSFTIVNSIFYVHIKFNMYVAKRSNKCVQKTMLTNLLSHRNGIYHRKTKKKNKMFQDFQQQSTRLNALKSDLKNFSSLSSISHTLTHTHTLFGRENNRFAFYVNKLNVSTSVDDKIFEITAA